MSDGLILLGKDPQGNKIGFNTDAEGNLVSGINSSKDLFDGSVGAESSVETDAHKAQGTHILISCDFGVSNQREIDIHWLNNNGDELTVDENIVVGTFFQKKTVEAKSPIFKLTIRNTHTSGRTVKVVVGSFVGVGIQNVDISSIPGVGISSLPDGSLSNQQSVKSVWNWASVGANDNVDTGAFTSIGQYILVHFRATAARAIRIDFHWLDENDEVVETDESVVDKTTSGFTDVFFMKTARVKFTLHNDSGSSTTMGITVSAFAGSALEVQKVNIENKIENRSRVRVLGSASGIEVNAGENKSVGSDVFGTSTYDFPNGQPVMIYFGIETTNHDEGYDILTTWRSRSPAEGADVSEQLTLFSSDGRRQSSEWIEIRGNAMTLNIRNNDTVQRTYTLTAFGIF